MSKRKKRTSGNPARAGHSLAGRIVLRDFERWMADEDETFSNPVHASAALGALLRDLGRNGLDLLDPEDVAEAFDLVDEDLIDVLHDYLHFRVATVPDDERWIDVHDEFEQLEAPPFPPVIGEAIENARQIPEATRQAALAQVTVVAGVRDLLAWIGKGRPITGTGALRRADIAPAAAFLGIRARGVAKLPPFGEEADADGEIPVQSMWDLPELAVWMQSLQAADVIEVTTSRLRPGPGAAAWAGDGPVPLDAAEMIAGAYLGQMMTGELDFGLFSTHAFARLVARLLRALEPSTTDELPVGPLDEILRHRTDRAIARFADAGLLQPDADDHLVPDPLRGVVARGIMLGLAYAAARGDLDELDDFDEFGGLDDFDDDGFGGFEDVDPDNPLADPRVRAEMARHGIVHKPGLAAEMMGELAPLLADEGIDMDDLGDTDLDTVNAALARATERHNMQLFTAVGEHHRLALAVLRMATEAYAEGNHELAGAVVASVPSDPTPTMPSVAHVIGTGLGLLDEWHTVRTGGLGAVPLPAGDAETVAAARDILARAGSGRALDGLGELIRRYFGKRVLEATALAVAGSVVALADRDGIPVRDAVSHLLVAD